MATEPESTSPEVLEISSRRDGSRAVVVVGGELDLHGSDRLTDEVKRVLADGAGAVQHLEIDARTLTFADSAGLRAVLLARADAQATGVTFAVTHVSPPVERVIDMAGLTEVLLDS
jgi:anti-anti-sigma factor